MKKIKGYIKTKILPSFEISEPTSHRKAVYYIAKELNISPFKVDQYITAFFGRDGLKYFINLKMEVNINGLGKFYFNKLTYNAFHNKRLNDNKTYINHRRKISKYNLKLK